MPSNYLCDQFSFSFLLPTTAFTPAAPTSTTVPTTATPTPTAVVATDTAAPATVTTAQPVVQVDKTNSASRAGRKKESRVETWCMM
ncbi:hypothetical protein SAMN02982919_01457 [Giesbergeria anulus]|uniref:Uncharacterized protein n=1 Tax=Giesbergeria anulus TaxID=180197 RepID=A0A1H9K5S0_9BURK|nr:hypothetical protein SAMN02982919_01457 [Giesbergeria anulus]